jgi:hypothetical protein
VDGIGAVVPPAGARIELTDRGAEHFRQQTGRDENNPDGRLVRVAEDNLYLATELTSVSFVGLAPRLDTVAIPFADVNRISVRELSKARSGLLLGGIMVGLGSYILWAFNAADGSGPGPGEGQEEGPETSVIPVLSVTISFR